MNYSTGPRTAQGKQRSSLNALRHGLTGQTVVIPSDDYQAYQNFCREFFQDYVPIGAVERQLVQTIADSSWRLNRLRAQEQTLLSIATVEAEDQIRTTEERSAAVLASALAFEKHAKNLANLSLYEQRLSRQLERSLKIIQQIQTDRKKVECEQLAEAALLKALHDENQATQPHPVPYNPITDGFVFSNHWIETYMDRETRLHYASAAGKKRQMALAA